MPGEWRPGLRLVSSSESYLSVRHRLKARVQNVSERRLNRLAGVLVETIHVRTGELVAELKQVAEQTFRPTGLYFPASAGREVNASSRIFDASKASLS